MIIDKAKEVFIESYSNEMMDFIGKLSSDRSLNLTDAKINLFNIKESYELFDKYLRGYAGYKIENLNNKEASPQYAIKETVEKFINNEIFKEDKVKYSEVDNFIKSYFEGIDTLLSTINQVKGLMNESSVNQEDIGDVNEFCDLFMTNMNKYFTEAMDKLLIASGYTMREKINNLNKSKKYIFL